MANSFTDVIPILIAQGLQTLREQCVMPRLVNTDYSNDPANVGDVVNLWIPSALPVSDVTPGPTPVTPPDSTPKKVPIQLNQWKKSGFHLTDKQRLEIIGGVQAKQAIEAVKSLANFVNSYILGKYKKIYGFAGTPGTTPFASDLVAAKQARIALNKQLAPMQDRRVVLDPDAEGNASILAQFLAADQRGDQGGIIQGQIGRKLGMDWFLDQQIPTHASTALSAGAATVNGAQAVGAGSTDGGRNGTVSIAKATNPSNLVAGDIITIAGDPQTYVVTADTTLIVGNTAVPIAPALKKATAGGEAVSLKASHVVNLAFHRDCFGFVSRPLQAASENAANIMSVPDPTSGVVLRLEVIRQNKQDYYEFDILFGAECCREELGCRIAG